jgi:hypothetical protein
LQSEKAPPRLCKNGAIADETCIKRQGVNRHVVLISLQSSNLFWFNKARDINLPKPFIVFPLLCSFEWEIAAERFLMVAVLLKLRG